jgi:hypothetical protein
MQRKLPLTLLVIMGILGFAQIFSPHPGWQDFHDMLRNKLLRIIGAFALILGLGNLLRGHFIKIRRKASHWQYSIVTVIGFFVTAIIGLFGDQKDEIGSGLFRTVVGGFKFDIMTVYFQVLVPLGATMFALLAFFMASAAYRSFRAKGFLAILLLLSAFVVMLGQVPIGAAISRHFPEITDFIMRVPNTASKRGIELGITLGMIATMLKIMAGIERSWMGGGE